MIPPLHVPWLVTCHKTRKSGTVLLYLKFSTRDEENTGSVAATLNVRGKMVKLHIFSGYDTHPHLLWEYGPVVSLSM